jgi:hypothetical protein
MALALLAFAHAVVAQPAPKQAGAVPLTGAAEVPGTGDSNGSGTVIVTPHPDKGEVCYELTVANLQDPVAAHIHEGPAGKEGPVKVELEAPKGGTVKGCKRADAAVIQGIMQNPANYYVNVHTAEFPKGAVRGQLAQ